MNVLDNDIEQSLETLSKGGLILYPTDTVWGIGCDATNGEAVSAVYKLKNRPEDKSLIVLLADVHDLRDYVKSVPENISAVLSSFETPTTVIYNDARNLASNLINEDGTIGIRIVQDPFCKMLIRNFGKPIVSSSANISGFPTPLMFREITQVVKIGVDYIVRHRQNELKPVRPSTIIKPDKDGNYQILR